MPRLTDYLCSIIRESLDQLDESDCIYR
jgi:hypothetical protein